mgnify:CR=1 FL=1
MPIECRLCGDRPATGWLELCLSCRVAYSRGAIGLLMLEVLIGHALGLRVVDGTDARGPNA